MHDIGFIFPSFTAFWLEIAYLSGFQPVFISQKCSYILSLLNSLLTHAF